jgi:hypothetical protein
MILAAILYAISAVESGNNPRAIGKAGERSAYQFTRETWERETSLPFEVATEDASAAKVIAAKHVGSIVRSLAIKGKRATPEAVARAWNPKAPRDYAARVAAVYEDFVREERK